MLVFLMSEASMLNEPGPRIVPRPVLPYVPVLSVVGVKQDEIEPFIDRRVRERAVADLVRPVAGAGREHALGLRDRQRQAAAPGQDAAELPAAVRLGAGPRNLVDPARGRTCAVMS